MYVCRQMTNIYSSTCLQFRIHFSMRQPCSNKLSFNHTHTQTHTLILCQTHAHSCSIHTHTYTFMELKQLNMHTYTKDIPQACKKEKLHIGSFVFLSINERHRIMHANKKMQVNTENAQTPTNSDSMQYPWPLRLVWGTINHLH